MTPFQHATPAFRTFYGDDCLDFLPRELDRLGVRRAMIFCGASVARDAAALGLVQAALGERCAGRFEGVREHSPVPSVEEGARALADVRADAVIAVGGGSAVVTARASSILLAEGRPVHELCTRRSPEGRLSSPRLAAPKLAHWVVPTTPTTAYAKAGSAVRDAATGERLALFDPKTRAQAVFVHPVLALTAPVALAESASLNTLSMAVEGLESATDDPLAEALLRQALVLLAQWLPRLRAEPGNAELRGRLMLAALLCGQGTDHMGGGIASVLGHGVGTAFGIPNGIANAIVLPHAMRYNAAVTGERPLRAADALGRARTDPSAAPAEHAIAVVEALLARLPVPRRLRDAGVPRESLPGVAALAMDDWFIERNPRRVTSDDALGVLQAAW
jgi:alcohol dehydrogenase class IV